MNTNFIRGSHKALAFHSTADDTPPPSRKWRRERSPSRSARRSARSCQSVLVVLSDLFLLRRMIEDHRTVLRAGIKTLTVNRRRVMHPEEDVEQTLIGNPGRVELHLHNLDMPGLIGADVGVRRVSHCAPFIPDKQSRRHLRPCGSHLPRARSILRRTLPFPVSRPGAGWFSVLARVASAPGKNAFNQKPETASANTPSISLPYMHLPLPSADTLTTPGGAAKFKEKALQ